MARKLEVTTSEMLEMRKQGLSNRDIANCLGIHYSTVFNYIGRQPGRMDNLAAFMDKKKPMVEAPVEEHTKAIDTLSVAYELLKSADGNFKAEVDYESNTAIVLDAVISLDQLAELATFIVGLAGRVERRTIGK